MKQRETMLFRRGVALLLALSLAASLAGCGEAGTGASGAVMFLRKTEGTVTVSDAEGQRVEPAERLGLYSGYGVETKEESFAWIDIDKVKLAKLNENSGVAITRDGKSLAIELLSGGIFFNVTKPLAEDETMEIRTSTMMVGIRGTCGWVSENRVGLLEGTVTVVAGEQSVILNAGETAVLSQDGALEVRELTFESVPGYVARELLENEALRQAVLEACGLRIPTTYEELVEMLPDMVYSEQIDFEADGSPELLALEQRVREGHLFLVFRIFRMGSAGTTVLTTGSISSGLNPIRYACLLAERDGRMYVHLQSDAVYDTGEGYFMDDYYGFCAQRDGGRGDWGCTDSFVTVGASRESGFSTAAVLSERGFVEGVVEFTQDPPYGFDQYTDVRELYAVAPGT